MTRFVSEHDRQSIEHAFSSFDMKASQDVLLDMHASTVMIVMAVTVDLLAYNDMIQDVSSTCLL